MPGEIGFKSYCWSIGTTSFRTDNFNRNIEKQLELLHEFRNLPENLNVKWSGNNAFQKQYYEFLLERQFVTGDPKRPDKDAREMTSGLVDIGLLDKERMLTEAGEALLNIALSGDFSSDNLLEIPRDSFIYFRQMLKTSNRVDQNTVRPFLVFLYIVSRTGYLTNDEFTYLLPLCVNRETTGRIVEEILASRTGSLDYEKILLNILMQMPNYKEALELLQTEEISEDLLCTVGINRKSKQYDKPYYRLYTLLKRMVFGGENLALDFYEATTKLTNAKVGSAWRKYFFKSTGRSVIMREGNAVLHAVPILAAEDEETFNRCFFEIMHLFKAKATLSDYFDLNRRYFKATDTVIFEDGQVKLDVLPQCYAKTVAENLLELAFEETDVLTENPELKEISPYLAIDERTLYEELGKLLGRDITDTDSAKRVIRDERYTRLNKLIDERFRKETLIHLFTCFEERNDAEIRSLITDNADIPTMFEYVLGIAWYIISGRKGDVLDYMKLSLEADLLPKTHAGGGEADIVWEYPETDVYSAHTLLLEATLADGTNQRRMEMEPVSRHLGEYRLANPDREAYCIFATTWLHTNVISDFRGRRHMEYYNSAGTEYIDGMKILPVQTSEIKTLLQNDATYREVYCLLEAAYRTNGPAAEWYRENIQGKINHAVF